MKKHLSLLAILLMSLTISACNNSKSSSSLADSASSFESKSISESSLESSSLSETSSDLPSSSSSSGSSSSSNKPSSSSSSSSASSSSSSSSAPKMPDIGETYKSKSWDQIINDMAVRVLGHDAASKIPVFIAPDYEAIMGYATINEQQHLVFQVKCLGVNATSATRLYNEKMEENGFYLSSEGNYGYQMYDYYSDFFLGYSLDTEGDIPSFTIQARLQKTREEQWDTTSVNLYSDMEVPACPAPAYQTSYDSSSGTLTVFALFVDRNTIVSEYVNILTKNGFTYVSTDNYGFVTLVDDSGYLTVMLYLTYGEYDSDALYIKFTNIWPSIPILAYIGCAMFPKLESLTASYDGYSYVQYGDGEDDYALCIYFKDASSNDYYNYLNAIEAYDFNRGETTTSSTDIVDTTFLAYTMDGYTLKVRVMYQISSNVVCVAIYQAYQELF